MAWYMWIIAAVLVVLAVLEVRSRIRKRRTVPEARITAADRAEALLRLKEMYRRDEISDEEYHLERGKLIDLE